MIQNSQRFLNKYIVVLIGLITVLFLVYSFFIARKDTIFADGVGYFSYPYQFFTERNLNYKSESAKKTFGLIDYSDHQKLNKYPIGTGILLTPAYFLGNIINNIFYKDLNTNILSKGYQIAVGLNGILFLLIGISILKRILQKYFSEGITTFSLLIIAFGTNLFLYASADASFSHIYSFFSITLFLYYLIKWNDKCSMRNTLGLALGLGLTVLIRPSNITILVLFLLYGVELRNFKEGFPDRIKLLKSRGRNIVIILLLSLAIIVPQIIYWYSITNNFLVFSYINEGFNFLSPQIGNLLFSINRGVLIWHPIILLAVTSFIFRITKMNKLYLSIFTFLTINVFIIASWWYWDYGIGFGHRAFTDFMSIFAILIAATLTYINSIKSKDTKILSILFIIGLLIVNTMLALNYVQQKNLQKPNTIESYLDSIFKFHL